MTIYLINFVIAIALGALVGFERSFRGKGGFAGLRSFMFISFLGALSYFVSFTFNNFYIYIAILSVLFILIIVSYFFSAEKRFYGITTELSAFITFWKALFWNIYYLKDTLKERKVIQKKRKFSDIYLYKKIMVHEPAIAAFKKYYK